MISLSPGTLPADLQALLDALQEFHEANLLHVNVAKLAVVVFEKRKFRLGVELPAAAMHATWGCCLGATTSFIWTRHQGSLHVPFVVADSCSGIYRLSNA